MVVGTGNKRKVHFLHMFLEIKGASRQGEKIQSYYSSSEKVYHFGAVDLLDLGVAPSVPVSDLPAMAQPSKDLR